MSVAITLVDMLGSMPHWFAVLILGAVPITELRGAIPVAMGIYGMAPSEAFFFAVLGNLLPIIPLLLFLEPVSNYLRHYRIFDLFSPGSFQERAETIPTALKSMGFSP